MSYSIEKMSPSLSSKIKNERENTPDSLEEGLGDQLVVHVHSCGGAELSRAEHAADRFCILREHEMRGIQMVMSPATTALMVSIVTL